jgi:hypothetical protein
MMPTITHRISPSACGVERTNLRRTPVRGARIAQSNSRTRTAASNAEATATRVAVISLCSIGIRNNASGVITYIIAMTDAAANINGVITFAPNGVGSSPGNGNARECNTSVEILDEFARVSAIVISAYPVFTAESALTVLGVGIHAIARFPRHQSISAFAPALLSSTPAIGAIATA